MRPWWALLPFVAACSSQQSPGQPGTEVLEVGPLSPPVLRRYSAPELERAATSVLGAPAGIVAHLPPDARQNDFSRNAEAAVDPLTLAQLYDVTQDAVQQRELSQLPLPPCSDGAEARAPSCRDAIVAQLGELTLRRAPNEDETAGLRRLFDSEDNLENAVHTLLRALLAAPSFLYESSLGASDGTTPAGASRLSASELATTLASLISGGPPDALLSEAARHGELDGTDGRAKHAQRLLAQSDSREVFRRFVQEWLGTYRVDGLAKSSPIIDFSTISAALHAETDQLVDDVVAEQGGSLAILFAGGYGYVSPAGAKLYGIRAPAAGTRVSLEQLGRAGVLQQGSFLSVFAHESESAPVLRGKAVLERLLCRTLVPPSALGIEVTPVPADATLTTRERFTRHVVDDQCRGCHSQIDGAGFAFENFDAIGRLRRTEAGQAVDTSAHLTLDGVARDFSDSAELARALAVSDDLSDCAARQVARFATGRPSPELEEAFMSEMRRAEAAERRSISGLFVAFVRRPAFALRSAP